ncbi:hypothetical protein D3C85_1897550 [compost metagenome]
MEVIIFLSTADVEGDVVVALNVRVEFHDGLFFMVVKVAEVSEILVGGLRTVAN